MSEKEPTLEELQERIDTLIKKSKQAELLRGSIIKLQEDLIGELQEQLRLTERRLKFSWKAGLWLGLVVATVACTIINIVIAAVK